MHKANIFHSSPEAAAKFLNKIENNIDQWWYSKNTISYCRIKKNHAFTDNLKLDRIEKSLKN